MIKFKSYASPETLEEAYQLCINKRNVVLGGMLWLKMNSKNYNVAIDLKKLGLDTITEDDDNYIIGAMVSLRTLETSAALNEFSNGAFKHAVEHLIGVQFRNSATVGGSLAGRFGFSDVLTLFMALDAKVELYKAGIVSIPEFIKMPRPLGDLLVRVYVPKNVSAVVYQSQRNSATDFPALTCAVAKVGEEIRCSVGARPALANLVVDTEGKALEDAQAFGDCVAENTTFGSNMIASAAYRKRVCSVLVRRSLLALADQMK